MTLINLIELGAKVKYSQKSPEPSLSDVGFPRKATPVNNARLDDLAE